MRFPCVVRVFGNSLVMDDRDLIYSLGTERLSFCVGSIVFSQAFGSGFRHLLPESAHILIIRNKDRAYAFVRIRIYPVEGNYSICGNIEFYGDVIQGLVPLDIVFPVFFPVGIRCLPAVVLGFPVLGQRVRRCGGRGCLLVGRCGYTGIPGCRDIEEHAGFQPFRQGGIGFADGIYTYSVGFGNRIQCMSLEHLVQQVDSSLDVYLVSGYFYGSGYEVLGGGLRPGWGRQQETQQSGQQKSHTSRARRFVMLVSIRA